MLERYNKVILSYLTLIFVSNFLCLSFFFRYVPWVSETFHEQFPLSVKSQKVTRGFSRGVAALVFGQSCFGLRSKKVLVAREKKPLVPRVFAIGRDP